MRSGMASTFALSPTVTDRPSATSNGEGDAVQRSFRGVIRGQYEDEGDHIVDALLDDIDSTGLGDDEVGQRIDMDKAQISRIRQHKAHPPGRMFAWAIDNSRNKPPRVVVAICSAAEGEFKPKPPPSVEERHAATLDVLHEMGIGEVVRERVARRMGVKP